MSKVNPDDRKYSKEHEWIFDHGDGTATLGITDHAQELLTDIVFVELPAVGRLVGFGEAVAAVESVKSVSDIYCPIRGEVIEVNSKLETEPSLINADAFGEGWVFKLKVTDAGPTDSLMSAEAYTMFITTETH